MGMWAGKKSRVPFIAHEEVKKLPWESSLPRSSFGFKTDAWRHALRWVLSPWYGLLKLWL